jgi:pyruvate/2-oxoacid:ferredoxin oxidoreductase beta subunit
MIRRKRSKVFDYLRHEDPIAGGVALCTGCPLELLLRVVGKVLGEDVVIVGTPSCSAVVLYGHNLGSWHRLPYYGCVMTGVASSATGISRYYRRMGIDGTIVCFTGDGCAADVGFQPLSGAAERDEHIIYICYDNEGYMNTGVQRSSTTPIGARTSTTPVGTARRGKTTRGKNLPLIVAMHKGAYTATATLSHLEDLAGKLLKAKEKQRSGFVFLHVFSPCPTGWGFPADESIDLCRMAVRSNYYPLWEAERGRFRITHEVKRPRPLKEYLGRISKFRHLTESEAERLEREVNERYRLIREMSASMPLEGSPKGD